MARTAPPNSLTTAEVVALLGIDRERLMNWTKRGVIRRPFSINAKRCAWSFADVEAARSALEARARFTGTRPSRRRKA